MEIREAFKDDIREVAQLMLEEFSKEPFNEDADLEDVVRSLDFYYRIGKVFVSVSEEEIVGVVVLKFEQWWQGYVVLVEDLAVKESFQGEGIGDSLLEKTESYAKEIGAVLVGFSTDERSASVNLGSKRGYEVDRNRVFMKKFLN